ncbi:mitochondrial outer membrane protein porin of 36 kDa-like isoform X2 [Camellia sinensis]|uniref:mitochondrial outer membrane protein porin of 36 kDa-like isoform X2 n=1 Tax=Camellia sinensis TaxID=4442 RepID=UPI0010366CFC|nr:mitochondrial outer membrane protein porin of 36 kDa-like isoform X2 [Camellia sinensis]
MSKHPGIYYDIRRKARDIEVVKGLRTASRFITPFQNKVELQYLHDHARITAGINLAANTPLNFSGVVGNSFFSIGTDLSFDMVKKKFEKWDAGLSFNTAILIASLTLDDMGDTLSGSCYYTVSPQTNTAFGTELSHKFMSNETTFTLATQHSLFPITLVKTRVSSNGKVGALIQQQLFPSLFLFTIAGDVDVRDVSRTAKLGLSLAVKPLDQNK